MEVCLVVASGLKPTHFVVVGEPNDFPPHTYHYLFFGLCESIMDFHRDGDDARHYC